MKWQPWVGDAYQSGYRKGLKLLIFGHSHYRQDADVRAKADNPLFTQLVIEDHIRTAKYKFFKHIEDVVCGEELQHAARSDFWHRVAFSNYVQELIDAPGRNPSHGQWEGGQKAFPQIINKARPDVIFVFSLTVWNQLPSAADFPGSENIFDMTDAAYLWKIADRYVLGGGFAHQRNPLVGRDIWHVWSEWLLEEATRRLGKSR